MKRRGFLKTIAAAMAIPVVGRAAVKEEEPEPVDELHPWDDEIFAEPPEPKTAYNAYMQNRWLKEEDWEAGGPGMLEPKGKWVGIERSHAEGVRYEAKTFGIKLRVEEATRRSVLLANDYIKNFEQQLLNNPRLKAIFEEQDDD